MRVTSVHISLADDSLQLLVGIDRAFVHIVLDSHPVSVVNELGKINLTHHGRHHVRVLQVEVIIWTIEICWHHCYIVGAILQVIALAHLQSCDFGDGIFLVGVFERRCEQRVFLHRLRCIFGIDACGTEEEQLFNTMGICIADYVALHLHVLHDEVGTI